jgi:tetratricopeptide (TPR) repeat protein
MQDNPMVPGGEFAGRYTIERELGRGGAAIVYLARDNQQERQVALKVLHRELAQAIGAQRFLREIKHSSSLQHPHLLSIHESGESDGLLYYVMPYMADGSLRRRIAKEKQLSIEEALRVTRHVGEALAYAHSRGIVHRDIKPDNVLFSGDHACLADFGIARAVDSVAADTLTSTGLVVGTPAYMSPEQASGEREVDARSDQYSLACLLYEMITGLPPFIGATQQSVISQRFTQPPPSMRAHRPTVPDHVERAVKRGLAVVPSDRFPNVKEFVAALHDSSAAAEPVSVHRSRRRWFAVGAAAAIVMVAVIAAKPSADWVRGAFGPQVDTSKFVVLPFRSEADSGVGIRVATAIHAGLGRWEGLPLVDHLTVGDAVRERGSVKSLDDAYAIAGKLGAGRLVWGQVLQEGEQTTVHAELYDVPTRKGIGRTTVTLPGGAIVDTLFFDIVTSLVGADAIPSSMDAGVRGTSSWSAWQAYSRAVAALAAWKLAEAERDLRLAVDADPDFAVAQLHLAQILSWTRPESDHSWLVNARRAVASRGELRERDAQRAEALLSFGLREYDRSCGLYSALVRQDTLDPVAWFSLGGCRRSDNIVVPDRRSRSRWSFRSSWHEAGRAFARAYDIDPRLHAIPRFDWVKPVFAIDRNKIRRGQRTVEGSTEFLAHPNLVADTIAYTPYPIPDFEQENGPAFRARMADALNHNRDVLLGITTSWTRTYPRSADAFRALAAVRENRDELTGSDASAGALQALNRARELAGTKADSSAIAEAEVRVLLKLARYAHARSLADSVLAGLGAPSLANWKSITRLAALTGRVSAFESALQFFPSEHAGARGLDQAVGKAGGQLLARTTLPICGPHAAAAEQSLRTLIQTRVRPEDRDAANSRVLGHGLSYMALCTNGRSMAAATRDQSAITRAQISFAHGELAATRAILDTLDRDRASMRPGDMAVNLGVRHAALRLHLGDTASAVRILDNTLEAIPTLSASIFGDQPLEPVMLLRAMVMRADLAGSGDPDAARKWSRVVLELWRNAESPLRPTLARMEVLSQIGVSRSR